MFKPLTESEVQFTLEALDEDSSPIDSFGYDTEEENEQAAKEIQEDIDSGNPYAWFVAKVTARWNGFHASEYLGCCSYKSEEDFKTESGYYPQMRSEALAALNEQLDDTYTLLKTRES